MEKKNIFEGAKFGDKFLTKDGRMTIFKSHHNTMARISAHYVKMWMEDCDHCLLWRYDGTAQAEQNHLDIVSKYQEPIDEKKLDKFAQQAFETEPVDLGLPSGTKWMKCNIGAEHEYDYGKYFQFGDTVGYMGDEAKAHSTWSTCPFNGGASSYDATYWNAHKSEVVDANGVLLPANDAAYVATNGAAKMPTKEQCQELLDNTTQEWVTDYQGSGHNGMLFISKTNGNTLFVPAAGYAGNGSVDDVGSYLNVWSSLLDSDYPYGAWGLYGYEVEAGVYNFRFYGFSVRGVLS